MTNGKHSLGFAPDDITDKRDFYNWKSKYDKEAQKEFYWEARYLFMLLIGIPILIFIIWIKAPKNLLGITESQYKVMAKYSYAWLGGSLGGTLFCMKWLYHSVAKGLWHSDRRLWRLLTPHLSGAIAFIFVVIITARIIPIFDPLSLSTPPMCISIGFFVGYFSDNAIAKLTAVADTLLGGISK